MGETNLETVLVGLLGLIIVALASAFGLVFVFAVVNFEVEWLVHLEA